jgi:cytoskeletal protein CcmA (bactofilin family)
VEIGEAASVEGNIVSRRLAMADGAVVRGRVETGTASTSTAPQKAAQTVEKA